MAASGDPLAPVLHKLISRAPPGQLCDIVSIVRQLLGPAELAAEVVGRACVDNNESCLLIVPLGKDQDDRNGIVCDFARVGSRAQREVHYLDPRTDMLFCVDEESQECKGVRPKPQHNDIKAEMQKLNAEHSRPFLQCLQEEVERYVAEQFPSGEGLACGCAYANPGKEVGDKIELRVYISSQRARPRGAWAGNWTSQWRVVLVPGQEEPAKLGGIIEFKSFYSEDGNVHFRRKATKVGRLNETTEPARFAAEFVSTVRQLEEEFHGYTEELSESFGSGALKAMRRVLPLSKERFDWRPLKHALVRDMKAAGKEGGS